MAVLRAFKGFRPKKDNVNEIASRPYDVLNSDEAREEVKGNPHSFLHVVKPEVDLPKDVDLHGEILYNKAKSNLKSLVDSGMFFQDEKDKFYIYGQTMWGKTQYGIVACSSVEDYNNNIIKKHELTRPDKEEDRMNHVRYTDANAEPVFFAFRDNKEINEIIEKTVKEKAEYDFKTDDEVGHHFWIINNDKTIKRITEIFDKEIPFVYVADGHHRTAAAALVGEERKNNNPNHNGDEEYNFFMSVNFPESQLTIIDYNRVVKDLNGMSDEEFITKLKENFVICEKKEEYKPNKLHNFSMYLSGKWYSLNAKNGTWKEDAVGVLDVTILTEHILEPHLNILDLRRSKRIDFVGGIRGIGELKKRVDSGEMKVAFALYPVSMKQLMDIADNDKIMPPKTTWFEPKLRSGLVFHSLK